MPLTISNTVGNNTTNTSTTPLAGNKPTGGLLGGWWDNNGNPYGIPQSFLPTANSTPSTAAPAKQNFSIPGLVTTPAIKSHTVKPDGSITVAYHAPGSTTPTGTQPTIQSSYSGGQQLPAAGTPEYTAAQNLAATQTPIPPTTAGAGGTPTTPTPSTTSLYGSLVSQGVLDAQEAAELNKKMALEEANIQGNPNYSLDTQVGRSGLIQKNIGTQATALAQESSAAFQGAGTVAPVTQFGQLTDPVTGQVIGGGGTLQSAVSTIAQKIQNGTMSYGDGLSALSGYGQAGQNALQQALGPGFNVNTSQGTTAGQQAIAGQIVNMKAANVAAKGIESTIGSYLDSNPQLNPSDLTFVNSIAQWASGQQLGDPKYQTLANYLNEYISTLAPILGVGGDTTNLKTQIAQSMINARASGESIKEALANTSQLADDKIQNLQSGAAGGGQVAGGGTSNVSIGGSNFVLQNGKWVVSQ